MNHKYRATDIKDQQGIYVMVNRQHLRNLERIASKSEILKIKAENEELKGIRRQNGYEELTLNFMNNDCVQLSGKIISETLGYDYLRNEEFSVYRYSSREFENLKALVKLMMARIERDKKEIDSLHKTLAKQSEELARLKREPQIINPKSWLMQAIENFRNRNK